MAVHEPLTSPVSGPERLVAAVAHGSWLIGIPLVVPAVTWLLGNAWKPASTYVQRQSVQAMAFHVATSVAVLVLLAVSFALGLGEFLLAAVRASGEILLYGAGAPLAGMAALFGEPDALAALATRDAEPIPSPLHWWPALTVLALALAVGVASGLVALAATVQTLRGKAYAYPLIGRYLEARG